ncbi:GFA family protein [Sinorhizobium numidicum]|uniref:GFA family protein n=1 Tax=Sinorhizobium numidicum TaxID=680248 RepID=A0ABY8D220_9HYPH|nr:GFA family protein [Sinorhizobium numidicum]WEX77073.1 GFA family protein [Sinorhizobium numidicum]WEX83732.1 GFA family protein [Sinorhizobium numidicum]
MKGGCLCGAVRYEAKRAPLYAGFCHCRDCQRVTGTGHSCYIIFSRSDVDFAGELRAYEKFAENGNVTVRHFCAACGSQIFSSGPPDDDRWTIYAGTLDDTSLFEPADAVFTRSRPHWDRLALQLDECETLPD